MLNLLRITGELQVLKCGLGSTACYLMQIYFKLQISELVTFLVTLSTFCGR